MLWCYGLGIRLAATFNPKAAKWIKGRQHLFKHLEAAMLKRGERPLVWIHAASLGEFEQGRPIIEALKREYPDVFILLTFFSPSGYEVRKNYELADFVSYLPLDSFSNAQKFIATIQPELAIFIKYELWYHYLRTLAKKNIPTLLISALFRPDQFFFRWYGTWFFPAIKGLSHIFVQNEASKRCLVDSGIQQVSISGDSRVDRVAALASSMEDQSSPVAQRIHKKILEAFCKNQPVLIAGSTWEEDEVILAPFIKKDTQWKIIVAPHDISSSRLKAIEKRFPNQTLRYSNAEESNISDCKILLIDNIGMLAYLYQYAKLAYIGGAFGKGLHNTLEPIAFSIPVIFGPRFQKFEEARWLVQQGGGWSVDSAEAFQAKMQIMEDEAYYQKSADTAKEYITTNQGATQKIMDFISKSGYLEQS